MAEKLLAEVTLAGDWRLTESTNGRLRLRPVFEDPQPEPAYPTFRVYWRGRPEVGVLLITAPSAVDAWMLGCQVLGCKRHMDIVAELIEQP